MAKSSWSYTELKIRVEEVSFFWPIKNYTAFSTKSKFTSSPVFEGNPKTGRQWRLKAKVSASGNRESLELFLQVVKFGKKDAIPISKYHNTVLADFQFSLCDPEGNQLNHEVKKSTPHLFMHKEDDWGWPNFCSVTDFTDPAKGVLVDDTLTVQCRIWIHGQLQHETGSQVSAENMEVINRRNAEVVSDLQTLRTNEEYMDFAIVTSTRTFMVHKSILSARSSVFRAMLESPMTESTSSKLEISDFDEKTVSGMLDYVYCGKTDALEDKAEDLLCIANKYDLPGLKDSCEERLSSSLKAENAVDLVVLADLHNATKLKDTAIRFIDGNRKEVRKTEAFQRMFSSNPLMDLLLS